MTTVTLDCKNKNIPEIIEWCNSQFGAAQWNWRSQFPSYRYDFILPTEQAATHFKLRWA
jgi:hypothetical protein